MMGKPEITNEGARKRLESWYGDFLGELLYVHEGEGATIVVLTTRERPYCPGGAEPSELHVVRLFCLGDVWRISIDYDDEGALQA